MRTHDAVRGIRWSSLLLCALLAGCGGAKGDLEKWVAEVKARPAPPLDPLPVMQQFETFEYAAQNLRDPFSEAFSGAAGEAQLVLVRRDGATRAVLTLLSRQP